MTETQDDWVRTAYGPAVDLLMKQALSAANLIDRLDRLDVLYREHLTAKDITIAAKDDLIRELRRRAEAAEQRAVEQEPQPPLLVQWAGASSAPDDVPDPGDAAGWRRWWHYALYGKPARRRG